MVMKFASQITLLLLLMFHLAAARVTAPTAKPGCTDYKCGNINISYPFGMGKECYMEESFNVECNKTSHPPKAFLSSIKKELLYLSNSAGAVVNVSVKSMLSSSGSHVDLNLTGTPFLISRTNFIVAVGCNTRAKFWTGQGSDYVGCDSMCLDGISNSIDIMDACTSSGDCCLDLNLPLKLQVLNSSLEPKDNKQRMKGPSQAFLADQSWYWNLKGPQELKNLTSVPVSLVWMLQKDTWTYDNATMDCAVRSINSTTSLTYGCGCFSGYDSNPYVVPSCIDIDECEEGNYNCSRWTKCSNRNGSYTCVLDTVRVTILVVGLVLGVLLLLTGAWWTFKLTKERKCNRLKRKFFKRNGGLLLQQQISTSEGSVQKTKIFSSKELEIATDQFNLNRILGQGGQGTVYKGMLADGRIVAVKKSKIVDEEKLEEFINEVVILSQINHRNVVRLIGCCLETEVPLLVYEFIPNGTLFQYLHEQNEDFPLSWERRLQIATEVAGAISYLHSAAAIPIYHRDIKSTNILLDEKYRAKVSDFGTSRTISIEQTHLTTRVQGTFGYLDPEYFQSSQFTEKSDVYSFGVVLVELLSGKKPVFLSHSNQNTSLATHFIDLMEGNRLFDVLDAKVKELCTEEEAVVIANLAKRCLNFNGRNRPTMKEVAMELEGILFSRKGIMAEVTKEWDNSSTSITCCSFDNGKSDLSFESEFTISCETW